MIPPDMHSSPVAGEGDPPFFGDRCRGLHSVLELAHSEDGCIWAGPAIVDPLI